MRDKELVMWLIGDTSRVQFRAAITNDHLDPRRFPDLASAVATLGTGAQPPAIALLAQAWPGQFVEAEVDEFRNRAPLTRIGTLLGSWLEGEPRTGKPIAGAARMYWHQCPARGFDFNCLAWSLPVTAGDDDRLAGNFTPPLHSERLLTIGIVAHTRETYLAWHDLLGKIPATTHWLQHASNRAECEAILFDIARGDEAEFARLKNLRAQNKNCPLIAVVGFPRADDVRRLHVAGATAVVSKPVLAGDLLRMIRQLG